MRTSTVIAALFATGALAAPLQANKLEERALVYHTDVKVVTVYVTEGMPAPTPINKHKYKPHHQHPKPTPAPYVAHPAPAPAPQPAPAPAPQPAPAPAPYSAPAPAPAPASSGNVPLDVANKWRRAYGLDTFAWSDDCAANAKQTGENNDGHTLAHSGPINMGQVISTGAADDFELTYVAAWLCEVESDPELGGKCPSEMNELGMYHTDTGHHDILVNPSYKSIGCAFVRDGSGQTPGNPLWQGQWICNFDY